VPGRRLGEQDSDHPRTLLSAREQKELRALRRRRSRQQSARFLAEGIRLAEDLLASPLAVRWGAISSSLEDSERGRALVASLTRRGIPVRPLGDGEFAEHAATDTPQGVLLVADTPEWELRHLLEPGSAPRVILVLDGIQDPGNFGTLVRSAEALGAVGVLALPGSVDPWNPKSVRAAMGSSFRLPIVTASWDQAAPAMRASGFALLAAAVGGEPPPEHLQRVALVLGNEGAGVSAAVLREVDASVGIPLRGRAESLNVAAAAAILLHQLTR
jgi:RNA methyltransferase, TrmH family